MQRYNFDDQPEREPLDYSSYSPARGHSPAGYQNNGHYDNYNPGAHHDQFAPTTTRGGNKYGPGSHPDSRFNPQTRTQQPPPPPQHQGYAADYDYQSEPQYQPSQHSPPEPTYQLDHHQQRRAYPSRDEYAPPPSRREPDPKYNKPSPYGGQSVQSNITPGADNFGDAASGGMAGIAYQVAERIPRESGVEAMHQAQAGQGPYERTGGNEMGYSEGNYPPRAAQQGGFHQGYDHGRQPDVGENPFAGGSSHSGSSHSSIAAPAGYPGGPGGHGPPSSGRRSPPRGPYGGGGYGHDPYRDDPYQGYSSQAYQARAVPPMAATFNPNDIADDGDEGLEFRRPARTSMLSLHSNRSGRNNNGAEAGVVAAAAVGTAAAGGVVASAAAARSRNSNGAQYDAVNTGAAATSAYTGSRTHFTDEKSEWLAKQSGSRKKWKWCIGITVALIIIGAVVGGVVGGLVMKKGRSGFSAEEDEAANGDLGIKSKEIQELLSNNALKKVFPGMDYTPINTQYPECIHDPPSQNNITRDMAVLSKLTNTVRLYGTDCNQTEMVVEAIRKLELQDTMKVWIGVWQDGNQTTNDRQLSQLWDIIDQYKADPFEGVIVANEILFRKQMTTTELSNLLSLVRQNLTSMGVNLPVATSDLGDALNSEVAAQSDYIMANIHPFFAGVTDKDAATWTYAFWENQNKQYWKADTKKNVIAEVGWPSSGGTNCGSTGTSCGDKGSVASVEGIQTLLDDWVCQALNNGTNYFWFSAFDEPWKVRFNEDGREWEDQWGLMDVNRNLKDGITIPDCGGRTV